MMERLPGYAQGDPPGPHRPSLHDLQGRSAHRLLWESGSALLSILGTVYSRSSVAETERLIADHDSGWNHEFRSNLDQIDQYGDCACEVVVTDPISDVPTMFAALELDRRALWERIRELSGYDPEMAMEIPAVGGGQPSRQGIPAPSRPRKPLQRQRICPAPRSHSRLQRQAQALQPTVACSSLTVLCMNRRRPSWSAAFSCPNTETSLPPGAHSTGASASSTCRI